MFGLSFGEVVIIAILALLLLGPERLPDAAKKLGKGLRDIKKATDDLKDQVESEIYGQPQKPGRPALVPPVPVQPVPGPAGPPPVATAENVPGLDAALAEPAAPPGVGEAPPQPGPTITAPMPAVVPPAPEPDRNA